MNKWMDLSTWLSSKYENTTTSIRPTNMYWAPGTVLGFLDMMLNKLDWISALMEFIFEFTETDKIQ